MNHRHSHSSPLAPAVFFLLAAVFFDPAGDAAGPSAPALTNIGEVSTNPAAYRVAGRDANSRVWERTVWEPSGAGGLAPKTHCYTELATGLNHLENGRWVESRAQIERLPDGRAAATHGQHQSYFPADIYQGLIETVTPGGQALKSRPLGLGYAEGSNTVLMAVLKNSIGWVLGSNQVIYPDAFAGLKADLRYTYTISGLEQDVILREQPPQPEALGLNGTNARLQVVTEFFDAPEPVQTPRHSQDGLTDHQLSFRGMRMIQGRAFSLTGGTDAGQSRRETPVYKSWRHLGARACLVEEVPLACLRREISRLPAPVRPAAFAAGNGSGVNRPSAATAGQSLRLARSGGMNQDGLVLDYVLINNWTPENGFTFRGDTTYFISSNANFYDEGTNVIEGGTVIKFDIPTSGNQPSLNLEGPVVSCQTAPYRPAIFTVKDDNSVGETIAGSTGTPRGNYGGTWWAVNISYYNENLVLHDWRMSGLSTALQLEANSAELDNVQFVNCGTAMTLGWNSLTLNNALFDHVNQVVAVAGGAPAFTGSFITTHHCGVLGGAGLSQVSLANCLLVATTNLTGSAATTLVTNQVAVAANDAGVFQTVGAGAHYLAAGSPWRGAGTTKVAPAVLTGISARTTYPPVILSNLVFSTPQLFSLQAPRNTGPPDLGYHYDPLDYITDGLVVSNTTLSLSNGVATACYNRPGITLQNGAALTSVGTPLQPNWFVRCQSVQEQGLGVGGTNPPAGQNIAVQASSSPPVSGWFGFSHFATPAGGGAHFNDTGASAFGSLTVLNSELWEGTNDFSGASAVASTVLINNLFYRTTLFASNSSPQNVLSMSNNLLSQSRVTLIQPNSGSWSFFDNAVDNCTVATNSLVNNGFNAWINSSFAWSGAGNIVLTNDLLYQSGPLGNFYQPAGSPLVNAGSTTADQAGFFQYTTQTNEFKETNSVLDIGYHYVAVAANGTPMISNNNGLPDYLADANGDGLVDDGESPWMAPPVIVRQPASQVLYPGSNILFSATVSGLQLSLQWYCNANAVPGATNASLLIDDVQEGNAGVYCLAATNGAGGVTSSNAVLAVLAPPVILTQPASQSVLQSGLATLAVTAAGLNLHYQWFSNSVAMPGAVNPTLTVCAFSPSAAGNYYVVITNVAGTAASSNAVLTVQPITSQTVITAPSGAFNDVNHAVASAHSGDVVLIPPGTYVWSAPLFLNGVSLRGCGTNQTIIIDGLPPNVNGGTLISLAGAANEVTELSNFQIEACPTNATVTFNGVVTATGNPATPWRIDHMFFNGLYSKNIASYGNAMSLIDHNLFFMTAISVEMNSYGDQSGYASYSLPPNYGLSSSNELYIEDNYFTNIVGVPRQVCDGCGGARFVLRHNTIWNDNCGNHGTETGGNVRSTRSMEVYGNTFNYAPGIASAASQYFCMCFIRGGSGLIYSNTANGYQSILTLRNFRNTDTFSGQWAPYGGAGGTNPWDSNSPTLFLQGIHTGPNGANYLQVAGANWTINQWVGYTLSDTNTGLFSEVTTNDADTLYYLGSGIVHNTVMTFNTGDGFAVYQVYATIDQPGRGSGDLLQNNGYDANGNLLVVNTTTGTASWPHEVIEPIYLWANILNNGPPGAPGQNYCPYPTLQDGRDYFSNTAMPGYTPFAYPHPLTLTGVH